MMRKILALLLIAFAVASCKKDKSGDDTTPATPLVFTSLTANDTTMLVTDVATLSAVATGDDIQYFWSASYGSIIGSGATVQWTVCHPDTFRVTCKVKDKYDAELTKSIRMRVK